MVTPAHTDTGQFMVNPRTPKEMFCVVVIDDQENLNYVRRVSVEYFGKYMRKQNIYLYMYYFLFAGDC